MVNVKNLFGMAVMATALVGCSSNDDLSANGNGNGEINVGANYASFTIELPSTNGGTRADGVTPGTPEYNPGDANEYAVNNAQLVVFKQAGASEGEYTYVETVDLGNLEPWNKDNGSGVTRFANITAELSKATVKPTDKYYALIVLNNDGKVTLPTTEGTTYSSWNVAANATSTFLNKDNGFYMANAPEFVSGGEPTTLVAIKGIYRTKQEAQNKPATTVYVERGMAKVTIESTSFVSKNVETSTTYDGDKVQITNWTLDVLNKSTFPVHKTTGLTTSYPAIWSNTANTTDRFVGGGEFKRVYWGIDPNYDGSTLTTVANCQNQFYIVDPNGSTYNGDNTSTVTWTVKDKPLYCLENTFDINNMKQGQTTRVLFQATYSPKCVETSSSKTFFMIGNNPKVWNIEALKEQIANKAKEVLNTSATVTVDIKTSAPLLEGGTHFLTENDVTIKEGSVDKTTGFDFDKLNIKLGLDKTVVDASGNKILGIKTYEEGKCYYIARIKHFNELTPWVAGNDTYGGNNEKWLGRYGVLRNNWYELTVTKFSAPGYPDVPVVNPETPDDEDTKFINVEVKILDWAKRSQQVEL